MKKNILFLSILFASAVSLCSFTDAGENGGGKEISCDTTTPDPCQIKTPDYTIYSTGIGHVKPL